MRPRTGIGFERPSSDGGFLEALIMTCIFLIPAIVLLTLAVTVAAEDYPPVVISEVCWMGSDLSTADEWLELAVTGDSIDISGWSVTSLKSNGEEQVLVQFPSGSVLEAGQIIVVSNNNRETSRLDIDPFLVSSGLSLPNTKLLLRLRDSAGLVIDEVDDGIGEPMAGFNSTALKSTMERVNILASGRAPSNWTTSIEFIGFDVDAPLKGTPGLVPVPQVPMMSSSSIPVVSSLSASSEESSALNESSSSQISSQESSASSASSQASAIPVTPGMVRISELLPNPVGADTLEWIEIEQFGESAIDLTGLSVSDGTRAFVFPAGTILDPLQPLIVPKAVSGLSLVNGGGTVTLASGMTIIDSLQYGAVIEGVSIGIMAGEELPRSFCVPTPGARNVVLVPAVEMSLQSGALRGEGKVTFNIQLLLSPGTLEGASCTVDFGDGKSSDACNPPSHTIDDPGTYVVSAEVTDYCGNTMTQSLQAEVWEKQTVTQTSSVSTSTSTQGLPVSNAIAAAKGEVRLLSALPNPSGQDKPENEWIMIENMLPERRSLDNYSVRLATSVRPLTGIVLEARESRKIALSSINGGLRNSDGSVTLVWNDSDLESVTWKDAQDGQVYESLPLQEGKQEGQVLRVVDGDTAEVLLLPQQLRRVIRLRGIDAPELSTFFHAAQPYSLESKKYLSDLLSNKKIELQFDTEVSDSYGRTLAYVHLEDEKDVQEIMLRNGLVRAVSAIDYSRKVTYKEFEDDAKKRGVGLWSDGKLIMEPFENLDVLDEGTVATLSQKSDVKVFFSEIFPSPAKGDAEWVELVSASDTPADLSGWSFAEESKGKRTVWKIPDGLILDPGSALVLKILSGSLQLNNGGQELLLLEPSGSVSDRVTYPNIASGVSYAKVENTWCVASPTPGTSNACRAPKAKKSTSKPRSVASTVVSALPGYLKTVFVADSENDEILSDVPQTDTGSDALFEELTEQIDTEDFSEPSTASGSAIPLFLGTLVGLGGSHIVRRLFFA